MIKVKRILSAVAAALLSGSLFVATAFAATPSSLPDTTSKRVLNLYKYSSTESLTDDGNGLGISDVFDPDALTAPTDTTKYRPMENVVFKGYKVSGLSAAPTKKASEYVADIGKSLTETFSVTTGAGGLATKDLGTGNTNDGYYLIVEQDSTGVTAKVAPFLVSVPSTNKDETGWLYNITVYPKNNVPGTPDIDKTVGSSEADQSKNISNTVEQERLWCIKPTLPSDIATAKKFTITDTLDARLNYMTDSLYVKYIDKDGKTSTTAIDKNGYELKSTIANKVTTLSVDFNATGRTALSAALTAGSKNAQALIFFKTTANNTASDAAAAGAQNGAIPNGATVAYTNSYNQVMEGKSVPEKPDVTYNGIYIQKVDATDTSKYLADATFKIANTEADAKNSVFIQRDGKDYAVTTGSTDGKAEFTGLGYAKGATQNYWVVETKAPDGYELQPAPIKISINASSHLSAATVKVSDTPKTFVFLPITGGKGTVTYAAVAGALVAIAAIVGTAMLLNSKKDKKSK